MSNVEKAKEIMHQLHDGVKYGGGLVMTDQVQGTVDKIASLYEGNNKDVVATAAYLHKCREKKRINPEHGPYALSDVRMIFGPKVAEIVSEVSSEPTGDVLDAKIVAFKQNNPRTGLSDKEVEWTVLADWGRGLSKEAQVILLAEKLRQIDPCLIFF